MSKKLALALLSGAFLMTAAGYQAANALNPQPLPPGRAIQRTDKVNPAILNNKFTPPDPCRGGAQPAMHTAMTANRAPMSNSAHCLNPQPLPPG